MAFLQGQRVREGEARGVVHARCQRLRGSALAKDVRESALSSVAASPWFVAPALKSRPFAVGLRNPWPGSDHQASSVAPSVRRRNLRFEALPKVELFVVDDEFRGFPDNRVRGSV